MKSSGHPRWVAALLVLGTLVTLVAVFSIWANRQLLNTDNWVDTSGRLLENEKVDEQLSAYLAQQFAGHDNIRTQLEAELPEKLKGLGAAVSAGLKGVAPQIAERALQDPDVQELWRGANRVAHERLLELLDGGGSKLSTEGGEVKLDLGEMAIAIGNELGVGRVERIISPGEVTLVILKSDQLSAAQEGAHIVRELPIVLTLLALVLFALAVWLAGPRRREALRGVGLGFAVAGAIVLVLRSIGGNVLVDAVVVNPSAKPAAHAAWGIATSLLETVAASTLAFGVLVFLAAWIAGPTALATTLRALAAPYLRGRRWAAYAAGALLFLVLVAWAPVTAFGKPLGILVLALLIALGTELLRRQIEREFPDAEAAGLGVGLRERFAGAPDEVSRLERLGRLHADGVLTDAEFATAKADLLGSESHP